MESKVGEATSEYQDLLPVMAEKLDVDTFVKELCGGFRLLADQGMRLITPASLRKNSVLLGMEGMSKEDAEAMVREGDLDGDGALDEMEFCILLVRVRPSPEMMLKHGLKKYSNNSCWHTRPPPDGSLPHS